MTDERLVRGIDGSTAIGVALDQRTEEPTVSVWIQGTGHPVQGTNLSGRGHQDELRTVGDGGIRLSRSTLNNLKPPAKAVRRPGTVDQSCHSDPKYRSRPPADWIIGRNQESTLSPKAAPANHRHRPLTRIRERSQRGASNRAPDGRNPIAMPKAMAANTA